MSKRALTQDEIIAIQRNEEYYSALLGAVERCKRFNVGDYVVRYWGEEKTPEMNSYHVERKFQVVYVDTNGIAYIKEVQGNKISSQLMCMIHGDDIDFDQVRYELDPLYADSVIMAQEGTYDPSSLHKDKSELFKEITKHNKALKVKTGRPAESLKFFNTLKVGDTIWFSNVTSFLIQDIKSPKVVTPNSSRIDYNAEVLIGTTNKGKALRLSINDLNRKAIYTGCPRSYKELKTK